MANDEQYDLTTAAQDPAFLKASNADKIAFLSAHDAGFAKANPQDKAAYLNHILGNTQVTQFEKDRTPQGSALVRGAKAIGSDVVGAVRGAAEMMGTQNPAAIIDKAAGLGLDTVRRQQEGRSPAYQLAAGAGTLTGVMDPNASEEAADRGDTAGVAGHIAVPATMAALGAEKLAGGKLSGRALESATNFYRNKAMQVAKATYTPSGELTPGAQAIASPLTKAPEYVLRKLISDPNEEFQVPKGASQSVTQSPYYNQIKEARATQAKLVKQAAKEELARRNLPPEPFQGGTSSAAPVGNAQLPQPGTGPSATTSPAAPNVQMVDNFSQDLISRTKPIVRPGAEPTAADLKRAGDLTQVGFAKLQLLAKFGDKLAQNEIIRRLRQ